MPKTLTASCFYLVSLSDVSEILKAITRLPREVTTLSNIYLCSLRSSPFLTLDVVDSTVHKMRKLGLGKRTFSDTPKKPRLSIWGPLALF